MKIAVIPARGGSKRIPRKNIRPFAGRPMLAHAIELARRAALFDHVVVSTDDLEIASIAKTYEAKVPFIRSGELADDHTPTVPVISHAIEMCRRLNWDVEYACCIYPCTPFLEAQDLCEGLNLLKSARADYCFPVTEFPSAIQRALRRLPSGNMEPFDRRFELARTQDLEATYYDAGQFYWGSVNAWTTNNRIHSSGVGLIIPTWRAVDIDTQADWERAELMYRAVSQMRIQ